MRALEFITGHLIFKLCYNQIYQIKNHQESQYFLLVIFGECKQLFFCCNPCLFGRAEILVISSLHFGRNDDLIN